MIKGEVYFFSCECSASCSNCSYCKYRLRNTFYVLSFIGRCSFYYEMFRVSRTIFRQYTYDFMFIYLYIYMLHIFKYIYIFFIFIYIIYTYDFRYNS
jgi:hypothetical protein